MAASKTLSWNGRIAIIDRFKPCDDEIVKVMGVSQDEIDTARELQNAGVIVPTPDLDMTSYASLFALEDEPKKTRKSTATSTKIPPSTPSQTANKAPKSIKKRGRKGSKIATAFGAISSTPVPAEKFASDNGVSLAVLRQSRRFDSNPELGTVRVKKNHTTKVLEVWREVPNNT